VIGHTSSFPVVGNQGRREEEGGKKKTMPLREVGVLKLTSRQAKLRTTQTHMTPR